MYEAAVAHFQATGKRNFLNIAIKSADLVCQVFGPNGRHDVPGHEEIELALVKLYRATGEQKYLDEARFFLDERGRPHENPPRTFEPGSRFAIYNDPSCVPVVDLLRTSSSPETESIAAAEKSWPNHTVDRGGCLVSPRQPTLDRSRQRTGRWTG
jgi:hypothetical protein